QIQGEQSGLITLGQVPQALFLMSLGLGERLNALAQLQATDRDTLNRALHRRDALHQLISPLGLGQFNVLVQGKELTTDAQKQLQGLTQPTFG
ncbi:MAG: class I SAM-dependent methyltransferase, partial [Cyanobacteria bacterium P01_D01_bin.115]